MGDGDGRNAGIDAPEEPGRRRGIGARNRPLRSPGCPLRGRGGELGADVAIGSADYARYRFTPMTDTWSGVEKNAAGSRSRSAQRASKASASDWVMKPPRTRVGRKFV